MPVKLRTVLHYTLSSLGLDALPTQWRESLKSCIYTGDTPFNLRDEIKGLFTWSGGPRSSGVSFFCFHALGDTKQKNLTPLDRGPPLHVNRVLERGVQASVSVERQRRETRETRAAAREEKEMQMTIY